jgi:hypothetical protein
VNRPDEREIADFVAASARMLDITLPPGVFSGVVANTAILLDHAKRVMASDPPAASKDSLP